MRGRIDQFNQSTFASPNLPPKLQNLIVFFANVGGIRILKEKPQSTGYNKRIYTCVSITAILKFLCLFLSTFEILRNHGQSLSYDWLG